MKAKKNKKILIFGGSGFLGKTIIDLLLKLEFEVVVFTRKKFLEKNSFKHVSKKNIKIVSWDPNNIKFIEDEFLGAETTINLCGVLYENKRNDFFKVHSDLPSTLAELCVKFNVKNFLHVSALGVSETSKSRYSSSKASDPPRILNKPSPKNTKPIKNTRAPRKEIYNECHKSSSALFLSLAPNALEIEDDTAPPSAPNAIC